MGADERLFIVIYESLRATVAAVNGRLLWAIAVAALRRTNAGSSSRSPKATALSFTPLDWAMIVLMSCAKCSVLSRCFVITSKRHDLESVQQITHFQSTSLNTITLSVPRMLPCKARSANDLLPTGCAFWNAVGSFPCNERGGPLPRQYSLSAPA